MKRKDTIVKSATALFATQGFEATTTLEIAHKSKVTEPLIYYHFGGKDELFTHILDEAFSNYFKRLYELPQTTSTEIEKISNLFKMHFQIADDLPEMMRLILSSCPAEIKDPKSSCRKNYQKARQYLFDYFTGCLVRGIETGEFWDLPVDGTANMLVALTNGLLRQRIFHLADTDGVQEATMDFCRESLTMSGTIQ